MHAVVTLMVSGQVDPRMIASHLDQSQSSDQGVRERIISSSANRAQHLMGCAQFAGGETFRIVIC